MKSDLLENPDIGQNLCKGIRKIRIAIKSKGKEKKGGAKVLSYNTILAKIDTHKITLLKMYDKNEKDSISEKEIHTLLKKNGII
mgnify:CR=1 FL=1